MDFDTAARELYAAPYEGFMSARATLVKQAKADGEAELAKELGALRKPTRSAWLVNLLARSEGEQIGSLLDLGAALAEAHHSLSVDELRTLSAQRSQVVNGLTRRALALGAEQGHKASEAVRAEVAATLEAALADPAVGEAVRAGTLAKAAQWSGFGPAAVDASADTSGQLAEVVNLADRRRSQARTRASAALGEARRALADTAHQVEREQAAAERADRAVAEGEQLVNHLTTTLAAARKDLQKATKLQTEAQQAVVRAEQKRTAAERVVTEAEQKLANLREDS
ncbi:hypothetical protein ACQCX2_09015 [Propionibacteriaceae bacterium Y1700]|uniref:hypothetical protein n=1 Tax=Microlunatus sp. Y1700 TaxID=3418487 RepID=UPI003DA759C2